MVFPLQLQRHIPEFQYGDSQKAGYGLHTFNSGACAVYGYSSGSRNQRKLEIQEGISEVPEGLKDIPELDTLEKSF